MDTIFIFCGRRLVRHWPVLNLTQLEIADRIEAAGETLWRYGPVVAVGRKGNVLHLLETY